MQTVFDKQDLFMAQMCKDYALGKIPHKDIFKPYFDWKSGGPLIYTSVNKSEAYDIIQKARDVLYDFYEMYPDSYKDIPLSNNDDPWLEYTGFGKDKYIVSYLEALENEMTNLLVGGFFNE